MVGGVLHPVFLVMLEFQEFEIFNWHAWGCVLQGLPDADKKVGAPEI